MSYYAFYHILIDKDNEPVENYEELPKDLVQLLNDLDPEDTDDDEFAFDGLHEFHENDRTEKMLKISQQYPEYTFTIREFPLELDEVIFDFFRKGKHVQISMDLPLPTISDESFE